jgi:hypothetical protein
LLDQHPGARAAGLARVLHDGVDHHRDGRVQVGVVKNDLRAFANPTRMDNIRRAVIDLANKMNSLCPACQMPGYWIRDIERGLPCNACGMPTNQEIAEIWGCLKCQHSDKEGMKVLRFANPSQCQHCNP